VATVSPFAPRLVCVSRALGSLGRFAWQRAARSQRSSSSWGVKSAKTGVKHAAAPAAPDEKVSIFLVFLEPPRGLEPPDLRLQISLLYQ